MVKVNTYLWSKLTHIFIVKIDLIFKNNRLQAYIMPRVCYLVRREDKQTGSSQLMLTSEYPPSIHDMGETDDFLLFQSAGDTYQTAKEAMIYWLSNELENLKSPFQWV
jgi:hypothetical protein